MKHRTVFTTERGEFHQQRALAAAPAELAVTMLRQPDAATLRQQLAEATYFISERVGVIDAELLRAAPRLRLILRLGSLTHDIDLTAAQAAGIIVCRRPDPGVIAVAEHTVLQLLAVAKKAREVEAIALQASPEWGVSRRTDENTFAYNWSGRTQISSLYEATIGIMGFGEIGAELARRLKPWGCRVLYQRRRRLPAAVEQELGIVYADPAALTAASDYVVNLLPYLPETVNRLNAAWFAAMKPGAFVVSCGSGGTIDEAALAAALASGHLGGAALDSYAYEPLPANNPLVQLARSGANILLTPHTAAGGSTASANDTNRAGEYTPIMQHVRGEPLLYRVV